MRPSESVIRVLATLIPPIEITHLQAPRGVDRLYFNFDYVLSDEAGELHPPKDMDCREKLLLSTEEVKDIRVQILKDLRTC